MASPFDIDKKEREEIRAKERANPTVRTNTARDATSHKFTKGPHRTKIEAYNDPNNVPLGSGLLNKAKEALKSRGNLE